MREQSRTLRVLGAMLLAVIAAQLADAEGPSDGLLGQAIEAYGVALDTEDREARLEAFRSAERLFGGAVQEGAPSADLYANLGNSALQAERLGAAVLAYRRALRLDPDHARARQNLEHARDLLPEWVSRPEGPVLFDTFFFWHRTMSVAERMLAAGVCFALACGFVAAWVRWRSAIARNLSLLPALAWVLLVVSVALDPADGARDEAVVTSAEVTLRAADSARAPARFARPLPSGTEVRIEERREQWMRVSLYNGRDGWVRTSSVSVVDPSSG